MTRFSRFATLVMCGAFLLSDSLMAEEGKKPAGEAKPAPAAKDPAKAAAGDAAAAAKAQMEMWIKSATPGPEHKLLEYMVGDWDVTGKFWADPTTPPEESKGRQTATMMLGGRFAHYQYKGQFNNGPFEGAGISGYDNIAKKFVSTWVDTYGTGIMLMHGDYDAGKKEFTFIGENTMPDGTKSKMKEVIRVVSPDEHVMTFYDLPAGQPERKSMELTYKRAKPETTGGGAQ